VIVPAGDSLPRYVCESCGAIHYRNPKIVAGCLPVWGEKVLLCRRAIEPRYGLWTLPAGFMENDETTQEAALRETREEANACVSGIQIFALYNLPHINQVYIMFRGELEGGQASAGAETLEVALFEEARIPWSELAFPVIAETLELFFADRRYHCFQVHTGDISRNAESGYKIVRYRPV